MNKCNIHCEWMSTKRIISNPDGQVIPCCFFANSLQVSKWFDYPSDYDEQDYFDREQEYKLVDYAKSAARAKFEPILQSYLDNKDDLNIFNKSLEEIVSHPWFNELYESWDDSDKVSGICIKNCQVK